MARITSRLRERILKAIARRYGVRSHGEKPDSGGRVALFDRATDRQRARWQDGREASHDAERGWSRNEVHRRGVAR